jgi:gluconolactonase
VAEGLTFGEGPAVDGEGNVYFTDIPKMLVKKWSLDGTVTTVREDSGRANGLMFDKAGNLYACEMGARRISKRAPDGTVTTVAERCGGKRFNQPNDLWLDAKGGLYFTDPIYGTVDGEEADGRHVYYVQPNGTVVRAAEGFINPNGVVGTPDGKTLYVADHGADATFAFDMGKDGALSNQRQVIEHGSDGMTLDEKGNLYLTGGDSVVVYAPDGTKVDTIEVPERTTNVTFGGKDRKKLFITCASAMYALDMTVRGAKAPWE